MSAPAARPRSFWSQVIAATLARAVLNTAHRMVYPFLPEFSRGLGVTPGALTLLLSARSALGLTAPLAGGIPDRFGRRQAMLLGLGLFTLSAGWLAGWPALPGFAALVLGTVTAKFLFDPAMQAYLSDHTPYARRGLVIAFSELAWSLAALVGIPLAGISMARGGWQAPFAPLALAGAAAAAALWGILPAEPAPVGGAARAADWRAVWANPVVLAGLGLGLLISGGNEVLNVVYGVWLEQAFGLKVAERGLTLILIGVAELAGEGLVMAFSDRLGKRLAIGAGLALSAAAYAALPLASGSVAGALAALFVVFVAFEFTIVATIPLMTELVPAARGAVMSGNVAANAGGRMLGALLGGALFSAGIVWSGLAAAAINLAALVLLVGVVRESVDSRQ